MAQEKTLNDLFHDTLKDIYYAEKQILTTLPKMARAAQSEALWPHMLALAWQALCVILFVRFGAMIFRRRVMKSGKAGREKKGRIGATKAA